ncbi:MAG TPA: hypothetical protein PLS29_03285 [Acidimicrobiales bacterium]|nr:MAG: hypothetical protein B7Z69_03800 [Actinobacteria bacterium 21-73-9]HQU26036.1 hypothetical protein [Acidimicrobiales bacterium]
MATRLVRAGLIAAAALFSLAPAGAGALEHAAGPTGSAPEAPEAPRLAATGNAAAIAFYRKVAAATDAEASTHYTYSAAQTLVRVKNLGAGNLSWLMADPPKAGYRPAHGAVWLVASQGRTTYVTETVLPTSPAEGFAPFELVLTPRGEVMMAAPTTPSAPQRCVSRTSGTPYVGLDTATGKPIGYTVVGRFSALRRVGDTVYVTSTYSWGPQTAIEVDTVSATTYLPSRSVYRVLAHHGIPGFTFALDDITWGTTPPSPPVSNGVCATYLASIR